MFCILRLTLRNYFFYFSQFLLIQVNPWYGVVVGIFCCQEDLIHLKEATRIL